MAICISNCYSVPSRLFHHQTGRLREIPRLAMPVYAIGITPMLEMIKPESPKDITMKHVAFADDLG